jgi:hypothetical protein
LQKLIAYGKVMDDNAKTLADYSIKEGDFLVVMVAKVSLCDSSQNLRPDLLLSSQLRPSPPSLQCRRLSRLDPRQVLKLTKFLLLPPNQLLLLTKVRLWN